MLLLIGCGPQLPEDVAQAYNDLPKELDFNIHVKPIISDKCFACHGPDKATIKGGLQLHQKETAYAELVSSQGKYAIVPGSLSNSETFHRIISEDPDYLMPTSESNLTLSAKEKATLIKWIEDGAKYEPHWAFDKPTKYEPPKVNYPVVNDIDKFVFMKLQEEGLEPSIEADKELLLRRVSLDLIGLPPTLEEIENFTNDTSEDAYEKQIDRLLASSHYGEKMAIDWLDLARYSDTHGYQVDRYRDMSPWRDWVIKSFNENMSYDQFVMWQLAGDLMPNPGKEQLIATAFNRLHPQNLEGGIVDEEFRVEYVADRVSVLGQGFMALTLGCAKCHDHKFDPIAQKEFYELYSFFNNLNETGQISWDMAMPVPTMMLPTNQQEKIIELLEKSSKTKASEVKSIAEGEERAIQSWMASSGYQKLKFRAPTRGLVASLKLNNTLINEAGQGKLAFMNRQFSEGEFPNYVDGFKGKGLILDGDAWLDLDKIGIFKRNDPFSIGLWVNIPKELDNGVIFHKNQGSRLHSFRGYHLFLKENRLEVMLAHTWPDNAIIELTNLEVPKDQWVHLMVTYDGSSKSDGLKVYMDGNGLETRVEIDNLYKDIVFDYYEDQIYENPIEPGLQIGARWRGKGIGGSTIDEVLVYSTELTAIEVSQISNPGALKSLVNQAPGELSNKQKKRLKHFYLSNYSPAYSNSIESLKKARKALVDSTEKVQELMVMREMPKQRQAFILERGLYDSYGEEVSPNAPETILPWDEDLPKNRLGLAKWLLNPEHPLTARVAVNRYWQNYFGRGIVRTTEDFGNQGELPSHPELLDWLALKFIDSGWDVKQLQKIIVMSATYKQSSLTSPELAERDPQNMLLARGPAVRLTSEMMRDNALVASGLINPKIGGESVRPYQPEGIWNMNSDTYVQDTGEKLYRRSLYTIWKRSVPHPTLSTFDQPERNECTVRRQKTNTPLQALVLLNDPTYLEASKVIGEFITKTGDLKEGISKAYRKLTGRSIVASELDILLELQKSEYKNFKADSKKTKGWLAAGEYKINQSLDTNLVAANAIVASVILNSDASITKR